MFCDTHTQAASGSAPTLTVEVDGNVADASDTFRSICTCMKVNELARNCFCSMQLCMRAVVVFG